MVCCCEHIFINLSLLVPVTLHKYYYKPSSTSVQLFPLHRTKEIQFQKRSFTCKTTVWGRWTKPPKKSLKICFISSSETLNVLDVNGTSNFIKGRGLLQATINFCDLPPYKKADSNLGPVVGYPAEDKRCFCSFITDKF